MKEREGGRKKERMEEIEEEWKVGEIFLRMEREEEKIKKMRRK